MALTGSNTWDRSNPIRIALPTLSTPESVSPQGSHWNVNFCLPETMLNSTSNVESSFDIDCDVKWTEPRSNQSSSSSSSSGMDFFCSCCDVKMNSSAQMASHIRGRKHQSKAASCSIDILSIRSVSIKVKFRSRFKG
ncbi:unnamed protein product [Heterobilharzia americana]|nr:unnamed protein product [Heterobilharzia americana]